MEDRTMTNQVTIELAQKEDAEILASISKRSFETDVDVGSSLIGGPPGYDTADAQRFFMKMLEYYKILLEDEIVGGIALGATDGEQRILERIFVEPEHMKKGIGIKAMELSWEKYPVVQSWALDTPEWNVRTTNFYEKLGFKQIGWLDHGESWKLRWYEKNMDPSNPYKPMTIGSLRDGMRDIIVEGTITRIPDPREVKSRKTGDILRVSNADFEDETGKGVLVLWNEQITRVQKGERVRVVMGYTGSYQGVIQLNIGRIGRLITLL